MPRDPKVLLYVGIKNAVLALDEATGAERWRAALRSGDFVTVLWDGEALFAANAGEIWRLDPATGATLWHNEMKGLGRGLVSLASARAPGTAPQDAVGVAKKRKDEQAAAAAAG